MKRHIIPFTAIVITAFTFLSCRGDRKTRNLNEGEIYYSIDYVKNPSTVSKEMMPREMVIAFKHDRMLSEIKAPVGNIGIASIVNPQLGIYEIYVNLLAFKYSYEGDQKSSIPGFSAMEGLRYEETGRQKDICGFNCNEVLVYMQNQDKPHSIWYTKEINVENPNRLTPFHEIDGVLMSFFYIIGNAELRFTAEEIYLRNIPDRYFERRKNYQPVTSGYLDSLIRKMIAF